MYKPELNSMSASSTTISRRASLSSAALQRSSPVHSDVSLEALVSHLLAAKSALSSITAVWRANRIVSAARYALGESSVLSARTSYLRNGILEQVGVLQKVRSGVEDTYKYGVRDFKVI